MWLWVKPRGEGEWEWEISGKSGDWELGDNMIELCCFDSKLKWVKVCLKFDDVFFCRMLQWWDFLVAPLLNVRKCLQTHH